MSITRPSTDRRLSIRRATHAALLVAVTLLAIAVRIPVLSDFSPGDDEQDYRRAVQEGFWSIYVGTNTASFPSVVQRYLHDPSFRRQPWRHLMMEGDQLAVRHFHVPLAFYVSAVLASQAATNRAHRVFPLLASAACAPVVVAGLWALGISDWIAVLAGVLVAVDQRLIIASRILTPHPLYLLLACLFLIAFARLLVEPTPRRRFVAIGLFGASISCLELAPLLGLAAAIGAWLFGTNLDRVFGPSPSRWQSLAWFLLVIAISWPAGLLRLGYVTAYGAFAALATIYRSEYYGGADVFTLYHRLFGENLFLAFTAVLGIAAACWAWRTHKHHAALCVIGSYAAVALVFNWLNRYRNATYAAETTVILWLLFAVAMHALANRGRTGKIVSMSLLAVGWVAAFSELIAAI